MSLYQQPLQSSPPPGYQSLSMPPLPYGASSSSLVSSDLPELPLSREEMEWALQEESIFLDMAYNHWNNGAAAKETRRMQTDLWRQNKHLAERNLETLHLLEGLQLDYSKAQTDLRLEQERHASLLKDYRSVFTGNARETLALQLKAACQQAEEDSDQTASRFLDDQMSAEEFCRLFRDQRRLHHLRALKLEKFF